MRARQKIRATLVGVFIAEVLVLFLPILMHIYFLIPILGLAFFLAQYFLVPFLLGLVLGIRYINNKDRLYKAIEREIGSYGFENFNLGLANLGSQTTASFRKGFRDITFVLDHSLKNKNKRTIMRALKKELEAQSAAEYIMSYGWMILIVSILLMALFKLGLFSYSANICVPQAGFLCNNINLLGGGLLTFSIGTYAPMHIFGIACTIGSSQPTNFTGVNINSAPGKITITGTTCPTKSSSASGTIWIEYTTPYYSQPQIAEIGKFIASAQQPALSAVFNGKNSSIVVPYSALFNVGDPNFTFVAWVMPRGYPVKSTSGKGFPLSGIIFEREPSYAWGINSTGYLNWVIDYPGKTMPTNIYTPLNNFTQVVLTFNGFYVAAYKNGQLGSVIPAPIVNNSNLNALIIGARNASGTPNTFFNGSMVNIQIYNTTLSPQQVKYLYSEGLYGAPIANAGIVAWWPLDGNANDYSGNGNNGQASTVSWNAT
jgi:hypothetical protein